MTKREEPGSAPAGGLEPRVSPLRAVDPPHAGLRLRMPAAAAEVAGIRAAVVASAEAHGVTPELRNDVALAVSEACANVVLHAYLGAPTPGPLAVDTYRENDEFVVSVSDEGSGIAPRTDSPGLGLGLALIGRLTQRLEITDRDPVGAMVTMAFATAEP